MKKYDVTQPVVLKKGVYDLNKEKNFNYQLNRVINWDGGRYEDVIKVASKINCSADWKKDLIALGDEAMAEERTDNAIAYYRMSEFFVIDKIWVGYSKFWILPGCEDIPYVQTWMQVLKKRSFLALIWVAGAAIVAGIVVLVFGLILNF